MAWSEQQAQFAAGLLSPNHPAPASVMVPAGSNTAHRYDVYRNNVTKSLIDALLATYPVVTQLVGEEFARAMARVFVREAPPVSPVLLDYGAGFGDFIARFEPARALPYLADMARLEWARNRAFHAADAVPLGIGALAARFEAGADDLRVRLLPSAALVCSSHPIVSIWAAHQEEGASLRLDDLPSEGECALVVRPRLAVLVRTLSPQMAGFFAHLIAGDSLGEALARLQVEPNFDAGAAIAALFETNVVHALLPISTS